jgi:hypothetical protein
MALRGDELFLSYGVMGGFMQPQGHVQVLLNMLRGFTPQAALDAPRFCISAGSPDSEIKESGQKAGDINSEVYIEDGITPATVDKLRGAYTPRWRWPTGADGLAQRWATTRGRCLARRGECSGAVRLSSALRTPLAAWFGRPAQTRAPTGTRLLRFESVRPWSSSVDQTLWRPGSGLGPVKMANVQ